MYLKVKGQKYWHLNILKYESASTLNSIFKCKITYLRIFYFIIFIILLFVIINAFMNSCFNGEASAGALTACLSAKYVVDFILGINKVYYNIVICWLIGNFVLTNCIDNKICKVTHN